MEQGKRFFTREDLYDRGPMNDPAGVKQCPSLVQFTWYKNKEEMSFIVADLGMGIKKHLELAYPPFANDIEALKSAIKPAVSGTVEASDPYRAKNNEGAVASAITQNRPMVIT